MLTANQKFYVDQQNNQSIALGLVRAEKTDNAILQLVVVPYWLAASQYKTIAHLYRPEVIDQWVSTNKYNLETLWLSSLMLASALLLRSPAAIINQLIYFLTKKATVSIQWPWLVHLEVWIPDFTLLTPQAISSLAQ